MTRMHSVRGWLARWLHRFSVWVEPPFDEDPHQLEVRVVKVAAAAGSRDAAIAAVHGVTKHLDAKTIHLMLLLLAQDTAWSTPLGSVAYARAWAELREFDLLVGQIDDPR